MAVAEAIHEGGNSGGGAFIQVDCGVGTEESFRAGLLGEAGSGGDWVDRAKGGTLFLQNVERLPAEVQEAFVPVIKRTINEARLICASSCSLEGLVDEGRFQDEFFYRIATLPLVIPPLRDHVEDLPLLVKHFLEEAKNPDFEAAQIEFAPDAMEALKGYYWPGNLVELSQVVTSVASSSDKRVVGADQLPAKLRQVAGWPTLDEFLAEQAAAYTRRIVHACGGDKEQAARVLGCPVEAIDQTAK